MTTLIAIDSKLSANANLYALINDKLKAAGYQTVASDTTVTLSAPATGNGTENTGVQVTAKQGSGLINSAVFYYTRLALTETVLAPQTSYTVTDKDSWETVTALINSALELVPGETTLVHGTDPLTKPATGSVITLTLEPVETSYLYTGNPLTITLNWEEDLADLNHQALNGFATAEQQPENESTGEVAST